MRKYFGTDGVRGVANVDLTPELAYRLGKSAGYVLSKGSESAAKPVFAVGRDTRISGTMLESALIAGLTSSSVNVLQLGVLPTPGVAYFTKQLTNGGVMISASHNPFEDNGIKFFSHDGFKLPDEVELEIEHYIDHPEELPVYSGGQLGTIKQANNAVELYSNFLAQTIDTSLDELTIVLDCANGAATTVAPTLFKKLGATVHVIGNEPNGVNINVDCGSTHPEQLQKKVVELKADIGLAFDGDSDRLIAVDEKGQILDGDQILYICGKALQKKGRLTNNTVVSTVMSNFGFKKALTEHGIQNVQSAVGDRYVLEAMKEGNLSLGGEQSGHIIFLDLNTTGDGILAALQLVSVLKESKTSASSLVEGYQMYPQKLINVRVNDKKAWETNQDILSTIKMAEEELADSGRVLIRASGTENLVRVMVEGQYSEMVERLSQTIAEAVRVNS